eukprot:gene29876-33707_t
MEITQAEVPLPETRRQIEALQENIALTRNQLAALLGQGPGAGDSITRPSLNLQAKLALPSTVPAELLGRRPDISAARWRVEAAGKGIAVAKADFYPNINLATSFGPTAAGGGLLSFLSARNFTTTYGPAISLPIFEGGRLRGQLSATTAGYDQAVEHYNQLLSQALKSIADQIVTLQSVRRQQSLAAQSVAAAQKNVDIATRAYQRGLTSYLNVLTAQTQWLLQQQMVQQLLAQKLSAFATLTVALGGGLEPAPEEMAEASTDSGNAAPQLREAAVDWGQNELPNWIYVFKMVLAGLLALGIGYGLNLESPRSALITVFIVMQPQSGMILSKSFYRVIGTLVGSVAIVLL